jgi:cobalt/nickel transport system permease protein
MILPGDLRVRLLGGLAALLMIAPLSRPGPAFAALALVLAAFALGRQPLPWRRLWHLEAFLILLLLTLPFTLPGQPLLHLGPLTATAEGLTRALVLCAKVAASVLLLTLLFAATPPERLAAAFRALHLPEPLVRIFLGVLRYLSLIRAEMQRLQDAMRLRSFRPGSNRHTWRSYGHLIGMMLLRALHRADRVEEAMRLRGYSGRLLAESLPPLTRADLLAGLAVTLPAAALFLWDKA